MEPTEPTALAVQLMPMCVAQTFPLLLHLMSQVQSLKEQEPQAVQPRKHGQ
jgi:hypothetical protein